MVVNICIKGDSKFSPKKFSELTGLKLDIVAEPGEIAKYGRYKGQPLPYGTAWIMNIDTKDILKNHGAFKECFVDQVTVDIYDGDISCQSGLYIDKSLVNICSTIGASIEIIDFKNKTRLRNDKFNSILSKDTNSDE